MVIVYGTRCWGRADAIPGVGHVTCRFVHIMFAPLVPIETMFVLESDESRGMKVPFSFKAALSGWLRGGAILAGLGFVIGAIANFADGEILLGGASAIAGVLAWASFPVWGLIFGACSAQRKRELLGMLGVEDGPASQHAPPPQPQPYPQTYSQPPYPQPYSGPMPPAGGFGQPAPYGGYGGPVPPGYGAPPPPQQGYGAPPPPQYPSAPPQPMGPPGPPGWGPPRR